MYLELLRTKIILFSQKNEIKFWTSFNHKLKKKQQLDIDE